MADRAEHGIVVDAERLFQHLVEASPDAMLVIEKDIPEYLLINTAAEQLLGYTRSELLAIDALSILDPEDQDRLAQIIPQSEQTGSWRGELRLRRKDGAVVPCEATITCLDVGGHILYKGRFRDISRRNEAEAALRESEERLRQVTEHVDQVFWMSSLEKAEMLYISPAYERIWGRSPESLLADPRSWIDAIHPEDRERVCHAALTRQASGAYDETYRIIRADGAIRWVHDRAFPVRNADGKVYRVLGVATDITEARLAEAERERLLASEQAALTKLRATQDQIIQQERLRALGQMASGIAHDFNNALAPIVAYTDLLLSQPERLGDQARVADFLRMIQTAAEDATGIVRRLREFYRQRSDNDVIEPVQLDGLIAQVLSLTQFRWKDQAQARGASITITTSVQGSHPVAGNASDLREALTNLVFNAVDALPDGGTIAIDTQEDADAVVLTVRDTGVGMTEEVRLRCLEPFFTTKRDHGTGLGLGLVYGIVKRHQGALEITSAPGQGTTMSIRLPIWSHDAPEATVPSLLRAPRPLRVLVIEDEPLIRQAFVEYLHVDGHTVKTASNGRSGLEMFQVGKFDLVLTDRALPEMGGDQVASSIKQLEPDLPIIMVTGFGDLMKQQSQRPEGVSLVVSKPLTLSGLRRAIAQVTG